MGLFHFPPDLLGDVADHGDRVDRLERKRTQSASTDFTSTSTAALGWTRTVESTETPTNVGRITIPVGYSRLTIAGFFTCSDDLEITGASIDLLDGGWAGLVGGGFTSNRSTDSSWDFSAVGLFRCSRRIRSRVGIWATTAEDAGAVNATGCVFVDAFGGAP